MINALWPSGPRLCLGLMAVILLACANIQIELTPTPVAEPLQPTAKLAVGQPQPTPTKTPPPPPSPAAPPPATPAAVTFALKPKALPLPPTPQIIYNPPVLEPNQHISAQGSYTQSQWVASGPMVCRIERDSCAYHQLVGMIDPTIVFKREETAPFYTEDILVHPAMIQPLTRLSELVQTEWDGRYKLRVTDAYDSLLEHDLNQTNPQRKYSLHFEGRAVDFTTWPVDRSKYGRLCMLAFRAGFDWVHNEITHCHASINAPSLCLQCDP